MEQRGPSAAVRPGALSALLAEIVRFPPERAGWGRSLRPGAVIGRFELVKEIGGGGFGVVWEAKDRELGRAVAFKAVLAGRPDVCEERLLSEAEVAARLSHPNIVTLHDVGRTEDGPYLVLELLRGETLAKRLEQGPLPVREALRIAVEVAKGLAHAHAHGVIHRDLTPGNVFLCDDGQVKVLDLGMAHAFGHRKLDGGTPAYMAPEQAEGAPEDERTDVFALGVMLYRMLSGEEPYRGHEHRHSHPPPELDVSDAPALGGLVQRMLAPRPTDRPRDAGEVLAALSVFERELERGRAVAPPVRRRSRSRVRLATLVALGIAIGVAAAVVATRWRAGRDAPPATTTASVAVLPFSSLNVGEDAALFADAIHGDLLTQLSKISGLEVISRTSVLQYRTGTRNLAEIGAALGVASVLEGSVQRAGDRIRIEARLSDVRTNRQIWADRYDNELTDVFAIQSAVAEEIARALHARLSPEEKRRLGRRPTLNGDAYEAYLRGVEYESRPNQLATDFRYAEQMYRRAIELDPGFALAHARLSLLDASRIYWFQVDASPARLAEATSEAERALAIDPELAEAHLAAGYIPYVRRDFASAAKEFSIAQARDPNNIDVTVIVAYAQRRLGRLAEAVQNFQKAARIDPRSSAWPEDAAYTLSMLRRYPEAAQLYDRILALAPDNEVARIDASRMMLSWKGEDALAKSILAKLPATVDRSGTLTLNKHVVDLMKLFPRESTAALAATPVEFFTARQAVLPRTLLEAAAAAAAGQPTRARELYDAATRRLAGAVEEHPEDFRYRAALGRALAGAGRKEEAVREGRKAVELLPVSRDAIDGPSVLEDLAGVYAAVGESDEAIAQIEHLLSIPGWLSPSLLRIDGKWTPLRKEPRFRELAGLGTE